MSLSDFPICNKKMTRKSLGFCFTLDLFQRNLQANYDSCEICKLRPSQCSTSRSSQLYPDGIFSNRKVVIEIQQFPLNGSMLNGSFLLMVQNQLGTDRALTKYNFVVISSIVHIPLNGSILRWDRMKLITGIFCTWLFKNYQISTNYVQS